MQIRKDGVTFTVTFGEKFREVFGFPPDTSETVKVCKVMDCTGTSCDYCGFYNSEFHRPMIWDDEYVKPKSVKIGTKVECDKVTTEWLSSHFGQETTLCQCKRCGLYFKPSLGHRCRRK